MYLPMSQILKRTIIIKKNFEPGNEELQNEEKCQHAIHQDKCIASCFIKTKDTATQHGALSS